MLKANCKFGAIPVQVEADTIKDLIKECSFFAEVPTECDCGSVNIVPRHRNAKDNDFFEVFCQDCHKTMPLGQHKNGDTLFVKNSGGWQDAYRREQE